MAPKLRKSGRSRRLSVEEAVSVPLPDYVMATLLYWLCVGVSAIFFFH